MKHLEVLVVTKYTTTQRILNWQVFTVDTIETAIEKLQQQPYKVVAISHNFNEVDKRKLNQILSILDNTIILVEYNNDKSLSETVKASYWPKNKPGAERNYLDNWFEIKLANSIHSNQ
ncbi:hypothetical protein [Lacinutrix sp. Bg11-31]|uniref:hypothetical protein n=1 Tax=Lacinutrix sp. Bg11-31 TaxID=2057808 RepID=UPI000C311CF9|nr:hypothetical protein [Lacinutrix sp. Bg11-31]AUC81420.1 hypothetical protein CW733_04460 [Lacinutrix sp. Bg11-31]